MRALVGAWSSVALVLPGGTEDAMKLVGQIGVAHS